MLPPPQPSVEREDSIFGEAEESDDEALFGFGSGKKGQSLEMPETATPTSSRNTPLEPLPSQRVVSAPVGMAAARNLTPSQPIRKLPVESADAKSFTASVDLYPTPAADAIDSANPFLMEAAIPTEFSEPDAVERPASPRRRKEPVTDVGPNWKLWIIIGLAAYSFFMTVVAIWGWMRSPAAPAVKHDSSVPAVQKAKTR